MHVINGNFLKVTLLGAINIPEFSFDPSDLKLNTIDKETILVIYCDGDDCDISKRLANELQNIGYNNSYVFLGGLKDWTEAELPIEKGDVHE